MKAYDIIYLEEAMDNLGCAFDYAINVLKIQGEEFLNYFVNSKICSFFEKGHPSYVIGMSGIDLVHNIFNSLNINKDICYMKMQNFSIEYWIGSCLAYYQWYTSFPFKNIMYKVDYRYLKKMYQTYHEMDIQRFVEELNKLIINSRKETNLAKYRKLRGLSQSELAKKSDVSLRMIQLYEQRVNDIDKASFRVVYNLSVALGVDSSSLLENPTIDL